MSILTPDRLERPKHGAEFTLSAAEIRRRQLQADMDEFLKRGKIQVVPGIERAVDNVDYIAYRKMPCGHGL